MVFQIKISFPIKCFLASSILLKFARKATARETLLKGMTQYTWPPCTNKFILNIFFYLFYTNQATLMRRSTVLSHPLQLAFRAIAYNSELLITFSTEGHYYKKSMAIIFVAL
jgi:hypothetical protein